MKRFKNRFHRLQVLTLGILVGFSFLFVSSADARGYKARKKPSGENTVRHEVACDFSYSGGVSTKYTDRISHHTSKHRTRTRAELSKPIATRSGENQSAFYLKRIDFHSGKFRGSAVED